MILGSNPFKFFNFQEDVVHIIEPGFGAGSYRRMPNYDQKIPVVEFDRILDKYRERDWRDLDMIIRYKDKILTTEDAGFDKNFDFDIPYWQKKLLKFRYIQKKGPQRCLW